MNTDGKPIAWRRIVGVALVNVVVYAGAAVALHESRSRYLHDSEIARANIARSLASTISETLDRIDVSLSNVAFHVEQEITADSLFDSSLNSYLVRQKGLV